MIAKPSHRMAQRIEAYLRSALEQEFGRIAPVVTGWCQPEEAPVARLEFVGATPKGAARVSGSYALDLYVLTHAPEPSLLLAKAFGAAAEVVDRSWEETWSRASCDFMVRA